MTATADVATETWKSRQATSHDYPAIADFLATATGLGGRKFAADSRDVAEQLESAYPGAATVLRDGRGQVRGYAAIHPPHGLQPEILGDFVFDPQTPTRSVESIVAAGVARFRREAVQHPGTFLRVFIGADQSAAIEALRKHGASQEGQFIRTRKPLSEEDVDALRSASAAGVTVLSWPEVLTRGLGEQVRQVQYDTFLEHFGNMSKTPELWRHHIESRSFTPDFSLAAIDDKGVVIGYVLGSTYTAGASHGRERSAHTDYIGVRGDQRRHGLGELLLKKIWLAALQRGLSAASLGTDIHNRSNAHLLYRRLGYVAVEDQFAYLIDAGSAKGHGGPAN
ncbi:GNAT family N-acetyltransferase [Mycolicibacterium komossense]|uniref:GNAT family N-acetyltransferase n=1 Tax=Mycolicibacterium komossense TaxID=1779 RepID=A0ABT3C5R7_9MYCO|nr:GNAT family N-acetyltransferase [Mycolicibacterium komossense]MCV7224808.1 GNAT family N-acetyltransferase [Mycolicibacterium komossense]